MRRKAVLDRYVDYLDHIIRSRDTPGILYFIPLVRRLGPPVEQPSGGEFANISTQADDLWLIYVATANAIEQAHTFTEKTFNLAMIPPKLIIDAIVRPVQLLVERYKLVFEITKPNGIDDRLLASCRARVDATVKHRMGL